MDPLFKLTDLEFQRQFADCSLKPTFFNHIGHLRLAWIHIKIFGIDKAIDNVCSQIKKYDATHDDGTKFHTTLTIASLRTVYHFFLKSESDTFTEFIAEFPMLEKNFKELISAHYSLKCITSSKAKKEYVAPDLMAYD